MLGIFVAWVASGYHISLIVALAWSLGVLDFWTGNGKD
jgi:hypothetical protein